MIDLLDRRPIIVAIAGPNGAGKTTFYRTYLKRAGLRFINADVLAIETGLDAYAAARAAGALRHQFVEQRESFAFETVLSDPVGDKVAFLKHAAAVGYTVVMFYIAIASPQVSEERVAMRLSKGGHGVPAEKLVARFPRTMVNLSLAVRALPYVRVYDNSDLRRPYKHIATFLDGRRAQSIRAIPKWLAPWLG